MIVSVVRYYMDCFQSLKKYIIVHEEHAVEK